MSAGPQMRESNIRNTSMDCTISLASSHGLLMPAVATNLDRRGAVIHFRNESRLDMALEPAALVEVRVGLPPVAGRPPRLLHCLGRVTHKSLDRNHQLWLVLRFTQLFVRGEESEPGPEFRVRNGSVSDNRRGGRESAFAVGSNRGTPQNKV